MRISIIIPTLNEEALIGNLIRELHVRAAGEIHEIIVADGGSSDNTRQLAADAGAGVISCRKKRRSSQMNAGAENATGDLFYFLHADTIPPVAFDQRILTSVSNNAGAGCFQLTFSNHHPALRLYGWCTRFRITFFRYGDQSLFVRPELFHKIGGFDEALWLMEDHEMVRKLKQITQFDLLDQSVVTSARKYKDNGIIRLQFIFMIILFMYYFGAQQETLVHLYKSLIK